MSEADGTSKPTNQIPRVRLSKDVDLGKANRNCYKCLGSGVVRLEEIEDQGKMIKVPVICGCVTTGGGVKKDAFDRIMEKAQDHNHHGNFGKELASDIINMHGDGQSSAIRQLKDLQNKDTLTQDIQKQLDEALALIKASGINTEK